MQSLFDSLCQCLGSSATLPRDESDPVSSAHLSTPNRMHYDGNSPVSENPNASPATRRTSRLELKDPQWDALFDAVSPNVNNKFELHTHRHGGSPDSSPESSPRGTRSSPESSTRNNAATVETAHVLAKAKQAANPSRYRMMAPKEAQKAASATKSHKRKRPICSRDDIFRSRKNVQSVRRSGCNGEGQCYNPISRFLTNHQGFANALCFATPVRDEDEMEEELKDDHNDNNSLASDANTLNTCEDSMLLLDHKLAQMSQNQPPMPLFHDFKVNQNEPEGLRRIVDSDAHSSANLMLLWRQNQPPPPPQEPTPPPQDVLPSSSSSSSSGGGTSRGQARARLVPPQPIPEHEPPPPMKASSSGSSGSSCRSSRLQTGEI